MEKREPDGKTARGGRPGWERTALVALPALGVVFLALLLWGLAAGNGTPAVTQKTSSELISTKEIAELSVSEFVYNGIAQTYRANGEHDYNVLYRATVKAGVDAERITCEVDGERKTVVFNLPEFRIGTPVVDVGSIDTMPKQDNLYIDEVLKLCRKDVLAEAEKSGRFLASARENLKSAIEAWYSPVFEGYTFEYRFPDEEGGKGK